METPGHPADDPMTDFAVRRVDGVQAAVRVAGAGPAVILMPELPGISPDVARLGRWIGAAGFTVYLPSLFGTDGAYPTAERGRQVFAEVCLRREFRTLAGGGTSPVVAELRALARVAHAECGGPGVGAVGLFLTGNFALAMMLEPSVVAAVVNHPSLPLDDPAGLELSPADAAAIRSRLEADDLNVLGYRFDADRWCTAERFGAYRALLGERFDGRVVDGATANPDPPPFFGELVGTPHSVVTAHLVDRPGHPTVAARQAIVEYLAHRLHCWRP